MKFLKNYALGNVGKSSDGDWNRLKVVVPEDMISAIQGCFPLV